MEEPGRCPPERPVLRSLDPRSPAEPDVLDLTGGADLPSPRPEPTLPPLPPMSPLSPAARVPALQGLLQAVADLRATVRADLSLTAAAVDGGEAELAAWLLAEDRAALAGFERAAASRLAELQAADGGEPATVPLPSPPADEPAPRPTGGAAAARRSRLSQLSRLAPLAAAAVLVAFAAAVLPRGSAVPTAQPRNAAMTTYSEVSELAAEGAPATEVRAAAERLHAALAPLVAEGGKNPVAVVDAVMMLQAEQALLSQSADPTVLGPVLQEAAQLVAQLRLALPADRRFLLPPVPAPAPPVTAPRRPAASPHPAATQRPTPRPTVNPTPAAAPTSPAPRPSASPHPDASATPRPSGSPTPGPQDPAVNTGAAAEPLPTPSAG